MPRRRHFAVEKLSEGGQAAVRAAVEQRKTLAEVARALKDATGEHVATSSLHRWMQADQVRQRIERRQQAVDAALTMLRAEPDGRMARMVQLALEERLIQAEDQLGALDLAEQLALWRDMGKISLAHKKAAIAERDVAADEKRAEAAMIQALAARQMAEARLEAVRQAAQKAAQKLEDAEQKVAAGGRSLTAEELRAIREDVYGFAAMDAAS